MPADTALETFLFIDDRATPITSEVIYSEKGGGEPGFFYTGVKFRDLSAGGIKGLEGYLANFRRREPLP